MQKKNIYIFSGLGADERVFQRLHFANHNVHFIKWIPAYKDEPIEEYAARIASQIAHPNPILVGLSFGGIMAIEVSKLLQAEKIIIIASVKNRKEIPIYYRFLGKLNLHKILPSKVLKHSNVITNYLFGASTPFEKHLLKQILLDTDSSFLKWAIDRIVKWENTSNIQNIRHIHGTKDKIFPLRFVHSDFNILGGGHLMTLSHPEEIMQILENEFE